MTIEPTPLETTFGKLERPAETLMFSEYMRERNTEAFAENYPGLTGNWEYDRMRWEIIYSRKELAKLRGNL